MTSLIREIDSDWFSDFLLTGKYTFIKEDWVPCQNMITEVEDETIESILNIIRHSEGYMKNVRERKAWNKCIDVIGFLNTCLFPKKTIVRELLCLNVKYCHAVLNRVLKDLDREGFDESFRCGGCLEEGSKWCGELYDSE
jgi:hypothetical protein